MVKTDEFIADGTTRDEKSGLELISHAEQGRGRIKKRQNLF